MTRDEILAMPAGEELDILVAEKVMGWHKAIENGYEHWVDSDGRFQCGVSIYDFEDAEDFHTLKWHPSESILWAWDVVEKMKQRGHNLQMIEYAYNRTYASFIHGLDSDNWTEANGENCTPLAICRAALLAVME